MYRYLSKKILITKKTLKLWGIIPKLLYQSMSDNVHYVNLMPYKHKNGSQVGNRPYFQELFRKISSAGGRFRVGTYLILKKQKTLYPNKFGKGKTKKGLRPWVGINA